MDQEYENSRCERWKQTTKALLSAVDNKTCQLYSIPVVPDDLRKSNESAYIPKVVSIGPQYKGRKELLQTEEIKWRCVTTLLSRTLGMDVIENCMEEVLRLDAAVRASYVDEIKLDRYDLATNMVFDGCFLLELLICESKYDSELPIPFNDISPGIQVKKMKYILSDLLLLDNQIPIYILELLFEKLLGLSPQKRELIQNLALPIFGFSGKLKVKSTSHFLDIAYSFMEMKWIEKREKMQDQDKDQNLKPNQDKDRLNLNCCATKINMQDQDKDQNIKPNQDKDRLNLNRCATKLKAIGITIQCLDVPYKKNFIASTEFNKDNRILKIPTLKIKQTTEAMWLSYIAWEHHKKKLKTDSFSICTSSALLFSDLICCTADVQLLKDRGIIVCSEKEKISNRDLVAIFHSIAKGVDRGIIDDNHRAMFNAMNKISSVNYATNVFILLHHYVCKSLDLYYDVKDFFKRGNNFVFTVASFLTFVQTCYAIVAYHFPKKQ